MNIPKTRKVSIVFTTSSYTQIPSVEILLEKHRKQGFTLHIKETPNTFTYFLFFLQDLHFFFKDLLRWKKKTF